MKKKIVIAVLVLSLIVGVFSGCNSDKLSMSIEKIGNDVVYNQSMVGVSGTLNKYFRPEIVFENGDANKMKYITNNLHTENVVEANVDIVKGVYYEAYMDVDGTEYARAVVVFVEFATSADAEAAYNVINDNLNLKSNEDGTCDLEFGKVSTRKNVICVVAAYETNTMLELTRVFNNKNYVR